MNQDYTTNQPALITSASEERNYRYGLELLSKVVAKDVLNYPYGFRVDSELKSIGIDEIRQIDNFLKLKVASKEAINRYVFIRGAEKLTLQAQNAFLKTLEEPPSGTLIVLTAINPKALLETILSRVKIINLGPSSSEMQHELIDDVKAILSKTTFQKLAMIDKLAKDKTYLIELLTTLQKVSLATFEKSSNNDRWFKIYKNTNAAIDHLNRNVQPKLVMLNLFINV